jgi:hypothetical protein
MALLPSPPPTTPRKRPYEEVDEEAFEICDPFEPQPTPQKRRRTWTQFFLQAVGWNRDAVLLANDPTQEPSICEVHAIVKRAFPVSPISPSLVVAVGYRHSGNGKSLFTAIKVQIEYIARLRRDPGLLASPLFLFLQGAATCYEGWMHCKNALNQHQHELGSFQVSVLDRQDVEKLYAFLCQLERDLSFHATSLHKQQLLVGRIE